MRNLWIYGCSFSYPFWDGEIKDAGVPEITTAESWPSILSKKLNYKCQNRAQPGYGWNHISYTLEKDIQLAKTLPPNEVTRLEYELKEEWNEKMINQLIDQVDMLEQTQNILKEEVSITASMIKDGTEADGKLEELNRQLEELQNKKPNTRVIVKEIKVDKKGRKL
mgnify:CR=1 FL=1